MKPFDFSGKHDILLIGPEGSVLPMDEPYFRPIQIADRTWQVLSAGDYFYVLAGDHEGICIDAGMGCGDPRAYAEQLCGKPVHKILNTHHHFDHTANNGWFDQVYMSEKGKDLASVPHPGDSRFDGILFPRDYPREYIGAGFQMDLGGRIIETYAFPDHAESSLAYLDRKEGIFFVGDELSDFNKELLKITVREFAQQMEQMEALRESYHMCCAGAVIFYADYIEKYLCNARFILAGHEGLKMECPEPAENSPIPDGQGRIMYHRRQHGPGTGQPMNRQEYEAALEAQPYRRFMNFADSKIIYDIRRIG